MIIIRMFIMRHQRRNDRKRNPFIHADAGENGCLWTKLQKHRSFHGGYGVRGKYDASIRESWGRLGGLITEIIWKPGNLEVICCQVLSPVFLCLSGKKSVRRDESIGFNLQISYNKK